MCSLGTKPKCWELLHTDHTAADLLPLKFSEIHFLREHGPDGFFPGNVVELMGTSGSGKTQCLLDVIATCILPLSWKGVRLFGHEAGAIVFDLDMRFPVHRLVELMRARYNRALNPRTDCDSHEIGPDLNACEFEGLVEVCLKRLHVFRCSSTMQLLCTINGLQPLLNAATCKLVVIDSANAFLIPDRCNIAHGASLRRTLWASVRQLIDEHQLVLFACTAAIFLKGDPAGKDEDWRRMVDHCFYLDLARSNAPIFNAHCNGKLYHFYIGPAGIIPAPVAND